MFREAGIEMWRPFPKPAIIKPERSYPRWIRPQALLPRTHSSGASRTGRSDRRDLQGDHFEARKLAWAERGHDCDVGGIAPARHQDAADTRLVVAGVQRVPAVAEIHFEPSAEIHRCRVRRHADVAEIA